jgi:hypothetical protein
MGLGATVDATARGADGRPPPLFARHGTVLRSLIHVEVGYYSTYLDHCLLWLSLDKIKKIM